MSKASFGIQTSPFGTANSGESVTLYRLTNANGNTITMIDLGATLVSIEVPDRQGVKANVNAGFPSIDGYLQRHPYFGSTVGRFCNRIADGKFSIDGKTYSLFVNNGPNHLHGGKIGFDQIVWKAEQIQTDSTVGIRYTYLSANGEEGYPGTLSVSATYTWDNNNMLTIQFQATTDQTTHINLTNHAYFNLGGVTSGKVYSHRLTVDAAEYIPVNENMIPLGKPATVVGTPLDFRTATPIGDRIHQLDATRGYDHCFVVNGSSGKLRRAAAVTHPDSGRSMIVSTTQPGIQLYTGNFLEGTAATGGFEQHAAFCLETQHFPDSPNQPNFPSTLLKPGEQFDETTTFEFGVTS